MPFLPDFYISIDDVSFFDLQLHLGRLRLEWGSTTPQDRGSTSESMHGWASGQDPESL